MAKASSSPASDRIPLIQYEVEGELRSLYTQEEVDAYKQAKDIKFKAENNLLSSVDSGDVISVQNLLASYEQILSAKDFNSVSMTALLHASVEKTINQQEILAIILSNSLCDSVNHIEGYDIKPLLNAISTKDIRALTDMLDDVTLLNMSNKYGAVFITQILQLEDVNIIDFINNHQGFDINTCIILKNTKSSLLDFAARVGNEYVVRSLLKIENLEVINVQRTLSAAANNNMHPGIIKVFLDDSQGRFGMLEQDMHGDYGWQNIVQSCNLTAIDIAMSYHEAIPQNIAAELLRIAVESKKPLDVLTKLLSDSRFQEGLLYNDPHNPSVLTVAMSLNSEDLEVLESKAVIDLLKDHNAVPNILTFTQLSRAYNSNNLKLFTALLAPEADVNITDEYNQSMIRMISCTTHRDRDNSEKSKLCFKLLLEHPRLNMTWDIALELIGILQITDSHDGFAKIKMMLANERVISTGILNTENNGKTLLERSEFYHQYVIGILKEHGAICIPTLRKFNDAIVTNDNRLFAVLLEFSDKEMLSGVNGYGKTLLYQLLLDIPKHDNNTMEQLKSKAMLESILKNSKVNLEGIVLTNPEDAIYIIEALQKDPFLVPAGPISFTCHSGNVAEANATVNRLIAEHVLNQEAACDDVCAYLNPEIASSMVMSYLGTVNKGIDDQGLGGLK